MRDLIAPKSGCEASMDMLIKFRNERDSLESEILERDCL